MEVDAISNDGRVQEILKKFAYIGVQVMKNAVTNVSVSGSTLRSIHAEVETNRLIIYGREGFQALETGRGPRKSQEYGELDKKLEDWMDAKGFEAKLSKSGIWYFKIGKKWMSAKSLAWMINKKGDKKYKKGITKNIYSKELDKFVKELTNEITLYKLGQMLAKVTQPLKAA